MKTAFYFLGVYSLHKYIISYNPTIHQKVYLNEQWFTIFFYIIIIWFDSDHIAINSYTYLIE